MFKNALVSVSDKSGLLGFVLPLSKKGTRIVSTGGTGKFLAENGVPVVQVSEQTGFPEVMDGRVRTLHPSIHMALLARQNNPKDMELLRQHGLEPFDLVVGNLYPFEKMSGENLLDEELVEYIDIGGPALLRAASKNYETMTVVIDPADYSWILEKGNTSIEERRWLAAKTFSFISNYDSLVSDHLSRGKMTPFLSFGGSLVQELRYGENPQQKAFWYRNNKVFAGLQQAQMIQGKALSYNNILDIEAAIGALRDFDYPTAVSVKHNNPCGVASAAVPLTALQRSLKADPVSVFGGIIALNFEPDKECAEELNKLFLECIVAPSFSYEATQVLKSKKNVRILAWPHWKERAEKFEIKSISGGFLVQENDSTSQWNKDWKIIGEAPSEKIKADLEFAWKVCRHLKSNAIAIAENQTTLGLGMGQVNRVESVEHAIARMKKHHPGANNPVLASDAFFPFPDSIEIISKAGIRWVIQPGGSIKDEEVIERARSLKLNLILTGTRHFRH